MEWKTFNEDGRRKVIVTKELPGDRWLSALRDADCEVRICQSRDILTVETIRGAIGDRCDGAIGQLTEDWGDELFAALKAAGAKAFSNYAVGYKNVDVDAATAHGIPVGNTPGVLTETTAEMAVALLFAAARRIPEAQSFLRAGRFDGWLPDLFLGKRLWGGTLGIVGAGRIGQAVACMVAPGHDMDVVYHDILGVSEALESHFEALNRLRAESGRHALSCRRATDLGELLAAADVVSLHVLYDESTHHLIDGPALARMKPDAILVNTSRGAVIDERALVEQLRRHADFRVGLDVFEDEPRLAPGLAEQENAVIVPHIASGTRWTREGMATLAACNVAAMVRGDPVTNADALRVDDFLEGESFPRRAPSIVNAEALGLERALGR